MEDHPLGSRKASYLAIARSSCGKKGFVSHLADIFRKTAQSGLLRREGMTGGKKEGMGWRHGGSHCLRGEAMTRKTITTPSKVIWKMSEVCAVIERGFARLDGL